MTEDERITKVSALDVERRVQTELTLCQTYKEVHIRSLWDAGASHVTFHWELQTNMLLLNTNPPSRIHYVVVDSDLPRRIAGMVYCKVNGYLPLDPALREQVLLRIAK